MTREWFQQQNQIVQDKVQVEHNWDQKVLISKTENKFWDFKDCNSAESCEIQLANHTGIVKDNKIQIDVSYLKNQKI